MPGLPVNDEMGLNLKDCRFDGNVVGISMPAAPGFKINLESTSFSNNGQAIQIRESDFDKIRNAIQNLKIDGEARKKLLELLNEIQEHPKDGKAWGRFISTLRHMPQVIQTSGAFATITQFFTAS